MSKKYHMALFNFHFNPLLASRHGRDNKIHTTQISCKFHIVIFVDQRGLFIFKGWLWIHSHPFKHLRSVSRFFALHWLVTRLVPFLVTRRNGRGVVCIIPSYFPSFLYGLTDLYFVMTFNFNKIIFSSIIFSSYMDLTSIDFFSLYLR